MKKIIYLFFFIPLMINLAACYDDTGNYDYTDLPDVDIKMQDTVYATQFKTLELTADVDLNDAPESDYEFNWRIWSNEIGGVWEQKEIGNSRNLTYEVAEIPGSYTLVLTVTNKKTEVKTHKQIYLAVQGSITEGWMVLQEKEGCRRAARSAREAGRGARAVPARCASGGGDPRDPHRRARARLPAQV